MKDRWIYSTSSHFTRLFFLLHSFLAVWWSNDKRGRERETERETAMVDGGQGLIITPQFTLGQLCGAELSHGRPWLPRWGATALGGGATELMGDVIIFLLSERQTNRQEKQKQRGGRGGRKGGGRGGKGWSREKQKGRIKDRGESKGWRRKEKKRERHGKEEEGKKGIKRRGKGHRKEKVRKWLDGRGGEERMIEDKEEGIRRQESSESGRRQEEKRE